MMFYVLYTYDEFMPMVFFAYIVIQKTDVDKDNGPCTYSVAFSVWSALGA